MFNNVIFLANTFNTCFKENVNTEDTILILYEINSQDDTTQPYQNKATSQVEFLCYSLLKYTKSHNGRGENGEGEHFNWRLKHIHFPFPPLTSLLLIYVIYL